MKKEERYATAINAIIGIKNGNDALIYKLWLALLPEAKKESARLLTYVHPGLCDMEDMLQESYFALLRTLDKYCFTAYDNDNLYQFIAWYKNEIRAQTRKLRAVDRKPDPQLNAKSMDAAAFDDGEKTNADLVPDPNSFLEFEDQVTYVFLSELRDALFTLISNLSDKEKRVIEERYFDCRLLKDIAIGMHIKERSVIDIERTALLKLKIHESEVHLRSFLV